MIYRTVDETVSVEAIVREDSIWLTQKAMAALFGCSVVNVAMHLRNIFKGGELSKDAVIKKFLTTASDGKRHSTQYYSLDAIISVGCRVNAKRATQFRIWATGVLKAYMIKGFALDDERLKQGERLFGQDCFRELLERARSIRASERRIWQRITDIFRECSVDYDKDAPITRQFYSLVQNKFHYAITGETAAELVYHRANRTRPNMGLTTWKNSPDGRILKTDVTARQELSA